MQQNSTEKRVLVLQGGGALGAYQAGAYEALAQEGQMPDWLAGISIGAINAAITLLISLCLLSAGSMVKGLKTAIKASCNMERAAGMGFAG